jgi:hypothetical protein
MALVNINLCKSIYEDYSEELDEIFSSVEKTESLKESNESACMIYEHYGSIFDEIFLSVDEKYGRTPKSRLERQIVNFTELYRRGQVTDGMRFTMKYDGIIYRAKTVASTDGKNCYLQVLDEHGNPYRDEKTGGIIGLYESSSAAGIDVINLYRKNHGIQERVKTLRGTIYWVNEDGKTIRDLIDSM